MKSLFTKCSPLQKRDVIKIRFWKLDKKKSSLLIVLFKWETLCSIRIAWLGYTLFCNQSLETAVRGFLKLGDKQKNPLSILMGRTRISKKTFKNYHLILHLNFAGNPRTQNGNETRSAARIPTHSQIRTLMMSWIRLRSFFWGMLVQKDRKNTELWWDLGEAGCPLVRMQNTIQDEIRRPPYASDSFASAPLRLLQAVQKSNNNKNHHTAWDLSISSTRTNQLLPEITQQL